MRRACLFFAGIAVASALYPGCSDNPPPVPIDRTDAGADCLESRFWCPSPFAEPVGPVHGLRDDGRVDVTAEEAWPDRPPRPLPLEPRAVAEACAALAACINSSSIESGVYLFGSESAARVDAQSVCPFGRILPLGVNAAARVIPMDQFNESWDFLLRAVLDARGDCPRINRAMSERPSHIECQEDGCYATARHAVTCNGDVAAFDQSSTLTRDCSRSATRCSETSPTGCTDRALVRCTCGAKDRCDGDIKLGCDSCGFVSYHDCAWNGGHCEETTEGARCVAPFDSSTCVGGATCNGSSLSLCTAGGVVDVDCSAIPGMHCVPVTPDGDGGGGVLSLNISDCSYCTFALCDPCGPGECGTGGSDAGSGGTGAADARSDSEAVPTTDSGTTDGGNGLARDASL